jgi:hypothetical protein
MAGGLMTKKVIAYVWRQAKNCGGGLLLVCAECRANGRGYTGSPDMELTGPFDEAIACVFCKKMVQS